MNKSINILNRDNRYSDKQIFLRPGELYLAKEPTLIWTTLGSCVAIVFYNEPRKIASICHAQLPSRHTENGVCNIDCPVKCMQDSDESNDFKYVSCSIRHMAQQFKDIGVANNKIQVKLFGGSQVMAKNYRTKSIGEKNIEIAKNALNEHGLKVAGESIGGERGRTLYLYSDTGKVLIKKHREGTNI